MSLPSCPAAYIRIAGAADAADPDVRDQAHAVLTAARQLGWPPPAVYAEIGLPGWHRPGSVLGQLAGYLASGRHDAIMIADLSRISPDPADVLAFTVYCDRCRVTLAAVAEGRIDESRIAALYTRHLVVPA
ncbi:MAG: recombinase family protein [Actinomycetota bacterium]|nr:recombinase family protein [Actinomycetota bacterium]